MGNNMKKDNPEGKKKRKPVDQSYENIYTGHNQIVK